MAAPIAAAQTTRCRARRFFQEAMMRMLAILAIGFSLLVHSGPADAQDRFDILFEAVVTVRSTVPDDARTARSLGTEREGNGVVIDDNGLVLTIGYIILEADTIEVVLADDTSVPASLVAYDHDTGFGLLRTVRPLKVAPMQLGTSSQLAEGDPVVVMSAEGKDRVQGARVISRSEFVGYWEYLLDSAIYAAPSHSSFAGAALVGREGQLLGIGSIYTQLAVAGFGAVPCNMFVPIDLLKPILKDLIRRGRSDQPQRPWLGMHLDESIGRVIVLRTSPDGPAEKAGLKTGDVILTVDKTAVKGLGDFFRKVWALGPAGVDVPIGVLQGIEVRQVTVKSANRLEYLRIRPVSGRKSATYSF
jgi:S1-C subfamily serine protease